MLILTRRPDESIIIDDDIKIKVLGIRGNQNRISYILQFNVCLLNTESSRSEKRSDRQVATRISDLFALGTA